MSALIGITATGVALFIWVMGWLAGWENHTWDWRSTLMARPSKATDDIVLILLDQNIKLLQHSNFYQMTIHILLLQRNHTFQKEEASMRCQTCSIISNMLVRLPVYSIKLTIDAPLLAEVLRDGDASHSLLDDGVYVAHRPHASAHDPPRQPSKSDRGEEE